MLPLLPRVLNNALTCYHLVMWMSFEDSEKAARVTLQQHYNFVMNQAVSITYDLWHIIFMKILLIEDNQRTQEWVTQGAFRSGLCHWCRFWWQRWALSCAEGWLCIDHSGYYASGYGWLADLTNVKNSKANPCYLPYCKGFCRWQSQRAGQWGKWLSGKTFFIFWVAGKGSGTIKATSRFWIQH